MGLHIKIKCSHKCGAMPRHINLGNEKNMMLSTELYQITSFFQRIILARFAFHIFGSIELWIAFALQSPSLVFGKMPMESVYLETAKYGNFVFQLVNRNKTAPRIVHKSTYTESRPIDYLTLRQICPAMFIYI